MEEKISVIVPIYNVEKYIAACIESLCRQTYANMEIILVNDGSTDSSGSICNDFAQRDKRIKVFHVQNGGQSRARNIGLAHATGEYIGFVDGDDAAVPQMYGELIALMKEKKADITECNFVGRKAKEPDIMEEGQVIVLSGKAALSQHLDIRRKARFPSTSVWSKLFRRNILEGLAFPEGKIHEEYAFLCQAIYRCGTYVYVNEPLYRRTLRDDSTTAAAFSERALDKLAVYKERETFLEQAGEEALCALAYGQKYDLMLHYYNQSMMNNMLPQAERLRAELQKSVKDMMKSSMFFKRKVLILLLVYGKGIYGLLKRFR